MNNAAGEPVALCYDAPRDVRLRLNDVGLCPQDVDRERSNDVKPVRILRTGFSDVPRRDPFPCGA